MFKKLTNLCMYSISKNVIDWVITQVSKMGGTIYIGSIHG